MTGAMGHGDAGTRSSRRTPPPPPPKKECPDVKAMLNGVSPKMAKIGQKIKIATANDPGGWYVLGDSINGCTITAITDTDVEFSFECKEQNKTITVSLPRERR